MKKLIFAAVVLLLAASAYAQNIAGDWYGTLKAGADLPLVLHVRAEGDALKATLDSPAQKALGIPVAAVTLTDGKFTFSIADLGASYEGVWSGEQINGTFRQGGASLPLNFSRTPGASKPSVKLQEPVPPYPYRSENVTFGNKEAGITLAGTLTWPEQGGPFAAVVLVTGSGPQNRDEEVVGHRPFLVLADYLTRRGIAVLRYDDRGVGGSGGEYRKAVLDDFASDARAAVAYLKTRREADPSRIGVIGHSEGGTIAFLLAAEPGNGLAYIVSMAGMAIPGDSLLRMQRALIARAAGVPAGAVAQNEALIERINGLVNRYPADSIRRNLDRLTDQVLPDSLRTDAAYRANFQRGVAQLMEPELRSLMACDPGRALSGIVCPVLALGGDKDLQVPAEVNLTRIRERVKGPVTVCEYPGLNHLFQHCATGLIDEYGPNWETISPEVLRDIAVWIGQQKGR